MAEIRISNMEALGKPIRALLARRARQGRRGPVRRRRCRDRRDLRSAVRGGLCADRAGAQVRRQRLAQRDAVHHTLLVHSQDIAKFYKWREQNYPAMFAESKYPPNTLLVIDRLVQEQFLIEI